MAGVVTVGVTSAAVVAVAVNALTGVATVDMVCAPVELATVEDVPVVAEVLIEVVGDVPAEGVATVGVVLEFDLAATSVVASLTAGVVDAVGVVVEVLPATGSLVAGVVVALVVADGAAEGEDEDDVDVASVDGGCEVPVCAPPLLLIVTPGAISVVDEVLPDVVVSLAVVAVFVSLAVLEPPLVAVDSLVEAEPVSVVAVVVPPVESPDVALADVELPELVDEESDDDPVVSAWATPGEVATITPIPRAAANAPTRPMWRP